MLLVLKIKRAKLLGELSALKNKNNTRGVSLDLRSDFFTRYKNMYSELQDLNSLIKMEEKIEHAQHAQEMEKEYSFIKSSRGDLQYRSTNWNDDLSLDYNQPNDYELARRDALIWQRYKEPGSLSNDDLVISYRKYGAERLLLRYIASGFDKDKLRLTSKHMNYLDRFQKRAVATTQNVGTDADGGYLVPTETEAAVVHEMSYTGPFGGPEGGLGNWQRFITGGTKEISVNTSIDAEEAVYSTEALDLVAKKPIYAQREINFITLTQLMVWTVQLDQDAAGNFEQEARKNLGRAFGRKLNNDLTEDSRADINDKTKLVGLTSANASFGSIESNNAFDASSRGKTNAPIRYDEALDLKHAVDPIYRQGV